MNKKLIIIDGNSLLNRAYYAIRQPMITSEGMYTHGIYAFLNMFNKLTKDYKPDYAAVAFDRKAPTFRHEAFAEYKAGRKKTPPELLMQFAPLKEILEAMGVAILEIDGYEADDILGTVSLEGDENGIDTYVITGDRDAFQLASDHTTIIYTKRGVSDFEAYDQDAIVEEYGFTPQQFIDYKALMGDKSDNIPGVPGVGDKTARNLIVQYGSVENVLAAVDEMKAGKLKNNLEEFAAQAMMSKRLATIFRHVPLEYDFEQLEYTDADYGKLADLYRKYEFNSFLRKLVSEGKLKDTVPAASSNAANPDSSVSTPFDNLSILPDDTEIVHIEDSGILKEFLSGLHDAAFLWLKVFHDDAHVRKPDITSVCLAVENQFGIIHWDPSFAPALSSFFNDFAGGICGHDLKPDYYALMANGAAAAGSRSTLFDTLYDSAIAAYLLTPERSSYELSVLMADHFQEDFPSDKDIRKDAFVMDMFGGMYRTQAELGRRILSAAGRLMKIQAPQLAEQELLPLYQDTELPLVEVLADMEVRGIGADAGVLLEIGEALKARTAELTGMIHTLAGEEFNINSPQQLGHILFEKLDLPNGKKTKTGYSTSADILEKLADRHPIVPMVLEYRMLTKLTGTYADGMLPLIDENSRIHAHFQQTVAATGRLSCTEPNLQNIPIRTELGRQFRKAFVAQGDDRLLIGADYSQVELRIMAHLSGDPAMLESFAENKDIHTITAARVFGVAEQDVTPLMRSQAKAVNFGVIYGISGFGLAQDLDIPVREAQAYIDSYYAKHPGVRKYLDDCIAFAKKHGYVKTLCGRRRTIKEIHASNRNVRMFGERLAMNSPVQGTAADIIKIAMVSVYHRLKEECPDAHMILQVHDELIIDAPKNQREKVAGILEECMCNAVILNVPLVAEVNSGSNWFELK